MPEKVINISAYTGLENGEIEDLFPKDNFARIVAKFLPRQEEVDEDFDDIVVEDKTNVWTKLRSLQKHMGLLGNWLGRLDLLLL